MSYGQIWPRMNELVRDGATEESITRNFAAYKDEWKNKSIQDAVRLLQQMMGGRGNWYRDRSPPAYVLGVWFKTSIKGIWFSEGRPNAVLINPRKGQVLTAADIRFLARGVYEFHCIDDPNDPVPLIVDLSETEIGKGRKLRAFRVEQADQMPLSVFEETLRGFFEALSIAGIATPPAPVDRFSDLLRRRRS